MGEGVKKLYKHRNNTKMKTRIPLTSGINSMIG